MEFLGGLFSGLFNGIGNYFGSKAQAESAAAINSANLQAQREMNEFNVAENRRIHDLNWERSIQAWKMANEYNSPKAQMERFKEAGIHPIYAISRISGNSGSLSVPQAMPARVSAGLMSNATSVANPMAHMFNTLGSMITAAFNHWSRKDALDDAARRLSLQEQEFQFRKDQAAFHNSIAKGDYDARQFRHKINNYLDLRSILDSGPKFGEGKQGWKDMLKSGWNAFLNPNTYSNLVGDLYNAYVRGGKIHYRSTSGSRSTDTFDGNGVFRGNKISKISHKGLYF